MLGAVTGQLSFSIDAIMRFTRRAWSRGLSIGGTDAQSARPRMLQGRLPSTRPNRLTLHAYRMCLFTDTGSSQVVFPCIFFLLVSIVLFTPQYEYPYAIR